METKLGENKFTPQKANFNEKLRLRRLENAVYADEPVRTLHHRRHYYKGFVSTG